jgi:large subunit ribosomal protein L3
MKAILGIKIGMTQMFSPEGEVIPVTLVSAQPNQVTLRRKENKDGHDRVQLGLVKEGKEGKYLKKHEFAVELEDEVNEVSVEIFTPGDAVTVTGISKGKGFQGVVKRHGFKGGPASHGHTDWERKAGSIGSRYPQHVRKGKRMPGRMGADQVTVKNLVIAAVDADKNLLAIKGAVPGKRGSILEIVCK